MSTNTPELKICEKRRYKDKNEAEEMIRALIKLGRADEHTLSTYACRTCHNWHLTSRSNSHAHK